MQVRPGILTRGVATGRYRELTKPSTWCSGLIARADVAGYIAGQIAELIDAGWAVVIVR